MIRFLVDTDHVTLQERGHLGGDLVLVTRNQRHFSRVPGLRTEDWSAP